MQDSGGSRGQTVGAVMRQLDAAEGRLPVLPRAVLQNVATAVAAVTVVFVALTYLLGVAGLLWLVLDYAVSHARLLSSSGAGGSAVVYMVIAVVLLLVVLLLVKPAFKLGKAEGKPVKLRRADQPELYAYVDRLCELLGTPKPERIELYLDANASASLTGFAMGLFSRRPVLSLGMTLIAGMNAQQLTGIIAHELAHFTQGRGTRFRLIIHAINGWFARVVFERDRFDLMLARASAVPVVGWLLLPVHLILWAGRGILWVFMMISHAASGLVSRRGEYEADKFMAAVIGSEQLGLTLQRIAVLGMCLDGTQGDLRSSYMAGRLADDIPALAAARSRGLADERRKQLVRLIKLERAMWHSTHPTLVQRTRAARALKARPLLECDGPASDFVRDFEKLCRAQTKEAYKWMLGEEMQKIKLIPTAQLIDEIGAAERANEALGRFYQCQVMLTRPLLPADEAIDEHADADALAGRLAEARDAMLGRIKEYDKLVTRLNRVEERIGHLSVGLALAKAGFQLNPAEMRLNHATPASIRKAIAERRDKAEAIEQELAAFEPVVIDRLTSAVALLRHADIVEALGETEADAQRDVMRKVVLAGPSIKRTVPLFKSLHESCEAMITMLQAANRAPGGRKLMRSVDRLADELCDALSDLQRVLGDAVYPFEHADAATTIGGFVVAKLPEDRRDYEEIVFAVGEAIERYETLVARCMSVSAETAEQVETAAGFAQRQAPELADDLELYLQEAEHGVAVRKDAALGENWLAPLAAAAAIFIGVFLAGLGATSITPTVTSTLVPHHQQYQPTIVPTAFADPSAGPRFLDPVRDWRVDNLPKPGGPSFPKFPSVPGFDRSPNNPSPGYNNPYDPNRNRPNHSDPYNPSRNRPGHNNPGSRPYQPSRPQPYQPSSPQPYRPSGPSGPSSPSGPSGPSPGGF